MEDIVLQGNGWKFTYDENGEYIAKAIPWKTKPIHAEQPPYQVCTELERHYEKRLQKHLASALKDIVRYLNVN
jgi:hypothetical protein